jgi:hypothetical protein
LNELFINTTWYYVLAILVYLYIVITGVLLNITIVRDKTTELINTIKVKLSNLKQLVTSYDNSLKYFFHPLQNSFRKIFEFILFISGHVYRAEVYFTSVILPEIVEPVNYASLIFRKCYTNSQTVVITAAAFFFVVFYFILSIF